MTGADGAWEPYDDAKSPLVKLPSAIAASWLEPVIDKVSKLKGDRGHLERGHESVVESFLAALG